MNKSSVADKVWKSVSVVALCLLYWSTNLLEKDIKGIQGRITNLDEQVQELMRSVQQIQVKMNDLSASSVYTPEHVTAAQEDLSNPSYDNLLTNDPYREIILPQILGENFTPKGVLRTAHVGKPDNLSPFNGFEYVVRLYEACVPGLAEMHVGKYENFAPGLAVKIEEHDVQDGSGDKEFHIYLRQDVHWVPINSSLFPKQLQLSSHFQKSHPVTAHDFKFYYDAVMNPYLSEMRAVSLRSCFEDIVSFRIENDYKFIVRWRAHKIYNEEGQQESKVLYSAYLNTLALQPLPCFVYKYFANGEKIVVDDADPDTYRKHSIWAQNFSSHWASNYIVSCGAFYFAGMDDEKITLQRNPDFYDPKVALIEKRCIYLKDSSDSLFQDFKSGKLDIAYLPPSHVDNLAGFLQSQAYREQEKQGSPICEIVSMDRSFSYIGWNCNSLLFGSRQVRRAMNMLVDRNRMLEQCCGGYGVAVTGPFALCSPSYNKEVRGWHYSKEEAVFLLEEEGWIDSNGDGIREKEVNGVIIPFRFRLSYYVKSVTARTIAEYLATVCKEVGIDCQLVGLDMADYARAFDEKNFDAFLGGWCLGTPPEDLRSLWHSEGALEKGSANFIGFQNTEADKIIEQLKYEYNGDKRLALYHRFHEIVHEEAPYAFLWSRTSPLLYRGYVKNLFVPSALKEALPGAMDSSVYFNSVWIDQGGGNAKIHS